MSDWNDTWDVGGDGVPDDFDSVADFDDGTDVGDATDLGDGLDGADDVGDVLADADALVDDFVLTDLADLADLGGIADLLDVAVVAGAEDLAEHLAHDPTAEAADDVGAGEGAAPPLLAHDLTDVRDGSDPFAALAGRRLDDAELLNEIRHLRVASPFLPEEAEIPAEVLLDPKG
jgi:hypothetical protein